MPDVWLTTLEVAEQLRTNAKEIQLLCSTGQIEWRPKNASAARPTYLMSQRAVDDSTGQPPTAPPAMNERLAWSVSEIAEKTGIPASSVRKMIRRGLVKATNRSCGAGRPTYLIPDSELTRLISRTA